MTTATDLELLRAARALIAEWAPDEPNNVGGDQDCCVCGLDVWCDAAKGTEEMPNEEWYAATRLDPADPANHAHDCLWKRSRAALVVFDEEIRRLEVVQP